MIKLKDVSVIYDNENLALDNINLNIEKGQFVGIIGSSGGGKSTLLKVINLLVRPTSGKVYIGDEDIILLSEKGLRSIRREIGFIFQDYNLVEKSSVLENVLTGRLGFKSSFKSFFGLFNKGDYDIAVESLDKVGLKNRMFNRGDQLSGGQKQRVAIAKTLSQNAKIILADEPVSSLDLSSSRTVMDYFKMLNEKDNITIMINLHDVNIAKKYCSRIIGIKNGKVLFDKKAGDIDEEQLQCLYH